MKVIDDLPRFVQVKEPLECSLTGFGPRKRIAKNTKLQLKWTGKMTGPDGRQRVLKVTCGKHVYTLLETQSVNMVAVEDPLTYTIETISRFVLLPAVIQFEQVDTDDQLYQSSSAERSPICAADMIRGRPLKILCFETHDIGMAVINRRHSKPNDADIVVIPKGTGNQTVVLSEESSSDIYENTAFLTNVERAVKCSMYLLEADTQTTTWLTKYSQLG